MSTALAVGFVTECLKAVLREGLGSTAVSTVIGSYKVHSLAPDLIDTANLTENQVNVFLYQIAPNAALRNADLPTRSSAGEAVRRPVTAVDLHYLVTAYSKNESQAEVMLAQAAHVLHDRPCFTAPDLRNIETKWTNGGDDFLKNLAGAGLSGQIEIVRVAPQAQGAEEVSKLWTAFQAHYRPTLAFVASVVLIEAEGPGRRPVPVLTIGAEDRGPTVVAGLTPPIPLLERIDLPGQEVTAALSDTVTLAGHDLAGSNPRVRFTGLRDGRRLAATTVQTHADTEISLALADAKDFSDSALAADDAWAVGSYSVTADIEIGGKRRTTNRLVLTLAPAITALDLTRNGTTLHASVTCRPKVKAGQRVSLLVGDWEIAAPALATATAAIEFEEDMPARIASGDTLVCRLSVDDVESHFIDRTTAPPSFEADAVKVIP